MYQSPTKMGTMANNMLISIDVYYPNKWIYVHELYYQRRDTL